MPGIRTLLAAVLSAGALLAAAGTAHAAPASVEPSGAVDTSLLEAATPQTPGELDAIGPSGVAVVAWAWWLAARPDRAAPLLDHLLSLGNGAFGIRQRWTPFQPVNKRAYPANAIYSVVLVPVAQSFLVNGVGRGVKRAKKLLRERIAFRKGCFAYDDQRPKIGCVHNANASVLSLISWLGGGFRRSLRSEFAEAIRYERRTMLADGSWWYWQQAPTRATNDLSHQAGTAWVYLIAKDDRLNALGQRALGPIRSKFTTDTSLLTPSEQDNLNSSVAALVAGGDTSACAYVSDIPRWEREWANPDFGEEPAAAYFHVWSQLRCAALGVAT
jgi:hypothetical protein